jgi:hypothetical protein
MINTDNFKAGDIEHINPLLPSYENATKEDLIKIIQAQNKINIELANELKQVKTRKTNLKGFERYDEINFGNVHKTKDWTGYYDDHKKWNTGLFEHPELYHYDDQLTAFDKIEMGTVVDHIKSGKAGKAERTIGIKSRRDSRPAGITNYDFLC